jgi:lanosterol synthase
VLIAPLVITGEGVKSVVLAKLMGVEGGAVVDRSRLEDAIDILITYQNADGGYGTCEPARAGPWLEHLNASQVQLP